MQQLERGHLFEGKYTILQELGRGGFGTVYKAQQMGMDRYVAIKILTVQMEGEAALTARERFLREVRIISKLRHPNTVTIHDFGQTQQGLVYMVLEYVDGETLKQLVTRRGALEEKRALQIAHQIARSLSEAHRHGIIHRDLKPQNIMLMELGGEQDFVKVLDFGIARFHNKDDGKDLTNTGNPNERELIGTPRYMSPEQVRGQSLTGASDIYSLGLMLYEMLTGAPAVQGPTMMSLITQQVSNEPLNLPALHNFHPLVQQILLKATQKSFHHRYRTVDLLATEIEHAISELKREHASASGSSDFLLGNQYDHTPTMRQTGPQQQITRQHMTQQHQQQPHSDQMGGLLMSNNTPQTQAHSNTPSHQSFAPQIELEPMTPAYQPTPQPVAPQQAAPSNHTFNMPQDLPPAPDPGASSPFDHTEAGGYRRPLTNQLPALHPDDEEADASYVVTLLITCVLAVALFFAAYAAFLMVGAAVGILIDSEYRLITTIIIMILLLVIPIFTELGRKERFHVVYATLYRIKRVLSISLGLSIGTCCMISLAVPEKTITRLEGTPNWFFDEPNKEAPLQLQNARYSHGIASVMRSVLKPIGMLDMDDKKIDIDELSKQPQPTRPGTQDNAASKPSDNKGTALPPVLRRNTPAPTRPDTIKKQTQDAPKKSTSTKKTNENSKPKKSTKKSGQYEEW